MTRPSTIASSLLFTAMLMASHSQVAAQMQMPACHVMPSNPSIVAPEKLPPPEKLAGIGNLHFPISSKNAETQAWFDQGINLVFDFWDYEANRAFEQAIRSDPNCAICHWALSESLGIHNQEVRGYAHDELMKAVALRSHADKREKLYIVVAQAESGTFVGNAANKSGDNDELAKRLLRKIVRKYPKDVTARLLLAEALQDGYDPDTGAPRAGTAEMMTVLQSVLKEKPDDSGANHLWIHAVEASPRPDQALQSAGRLAALAPGSGHMTHMPGHIFYRTGNYQRAQDSFDLSMRVDEAYMTSQHVAADNDWNYVHNLMYSIANLLEQGRMTEAAAVSAKLPDARGERAATLYPWSTRDSITRLNPLLPIALRNADWQPALVLLKAATPPASQPNLQLLNQALIEFVQGMLSVAEKDMDAARNHSGELDAQLWRSSQQLDEQKAHEKTSQTADAATPQNEGEPTNPNLANLLKNLSILSLELRAAILLNTDKATDAEALYSQARREEKELGYHEPPAFIQPVAEQEAALLTAAGKAAEAEKAWEKALEDRPNSGFPLYGLADLAERSGDISRTDAAYNKFLEAWKKADLDLPQMKHARQWLAEHPDRALAGSAGSSPTESMR